MGNGRGKSSDIPAEAPVKGYQLKEVQVEVEAHDRFITAFGGKLDSIDEKFDRIIEMLSTRPTTDQVDAMITIAIKNTEERMSLTYGPIVANNKRLLWAVVTTSLGLLASLIVLGVGFATR